MVNKVETISSEVMDSLKGIGLNKYERNLWIALLRKGVASAGELAEISNVPRSRCYDVLASLADKGFSMIQPGKPMKYVAIEPVKALERAKHFEEKKAKEFSQKIEKMKTSTASKELKAVFNDNLEIKKPEHMSGAFKGRDSIHLQINSMIRNSKKSLKVVTTSDGLMDFVDRHGKHLNKASKAGVNIQIAAPINDDNRHVLKEVNKFGKIRDLGTHKHASKISSRLVLSDGKESLFALTHDKDTHPTQDTAFWVESEHAAGKTLEPMFQMIWDGSKDAK